VEAKETGHMSAEQQSTYTPVISVLVPAFNMAAYLESAIESVLRSSLNEIEVLVVDDGSTDNTGEVIESFTNYSHARYDCRVRYISQRNAGKSAALNRVLGEARGNYIAFLDADDQLPIDGLSLRYEVIRTSQGQPPELVIGGFKVFRGRKILGERTPPEENDPASLRRRFLFYYKTPFHLNSCLLARSLVKRVGFFDEKLMRAQDQDYSLRLLESARKIAVIDSAVYRYRKHRTSISARVRYRLRNLRYRPQMLLKHTRGFEKMAAVILGGAFDIGKLLYETGANYHD